jgi:hypothetical protein
MCRSTEMQIHYARMSEHYNTLADAELLGGLAYEPLLPEDTTSRAALNKRPDAPRRRRLAGRADRRVLARMASNVPDGLARRRGSRRS